MDADSSGCSRAGFCALSCTRAADVLACRWCWPCATAILLVRCSGVGIPVARWAARAAGGRIHELLPTSGAVIDQGPLAVAALGPRTEIGLRAGRCSARERVVVAGRFPGECRHDRDSPLVADL